MFTELKGKSADKRMADDAVKIIKDNNMEAECVLISLKYDLIDYIETKYPEIQQELKERADLQRMVDRILTIVS